MCFFSRVRLQELPEHEIEKEPVSFETGSFGRGRRTRTLNKGFGDPRVTITPCPYVLRTQELYLKTEGLSIALILNFA